MTRRNFFRNALSALAAVAVAQKVVGEWVRETVIESPAYSFDRPFKYIAISTPRCKDDVLRRFVIMEDNQTLLESWHDFNVQCPINPNYVDALPESKHYVLRDGKFVRTAP